MPTREQVIDAMYNTANDHDPVAAVMALIRSEKKDAWIEGYDAGNELGWDSSHTTPYEATEDTEAS